jgi:hypothetical protein
MGVFKVLTALLLMLIFSDAFSQEYTLRGVLKGVDSGWAFVRHRQTGQTDSARIVNGHFRLTGKVTDAEFCNFGYSAKGVKDYYLGFFLEAGTFTIHLDKKALNDVDIVFIGSPIEAAFQQYQRHVKYFQGHYYPESVPIYIEEYSATYAKKHPGSYICAFALSSYENDPAKLARLYRRLSLRVQQSYYGQIIRAKLVKH